MLAVQVSVLYCSASVHWVLYPILSRFLTLSPSRATVLVLHWIRFFSLLKAQVVVCFLCVHYNINCVICQDLLRCFSKISPTISLAFSSLFWWYISIPPVGLVTFNNLILGMYANVNPLVVTILVPLIILFSLSF